MKKVLVLGGTGFVGRHVCEHLNRLGIRATVPTRRSINAQAVQMLPLVDVIEADVHDEAALSRLLPGHDAVINLVAVLHGSPKRFQQVHVELPRTLARAMNASGVRRLVHVSALGASEQGSSDYLASKGAGEAVLQQAGLDLTLIRPSVIFGAGDRFLNLFARLQAQLPMMALGGADTHMQPVWVGDVAETIVHSLRHPGTVGQIIECVGPRVYTLRELVAAAGRLAGLPPRRIIGLPRAIAYFQALFIQSLPGEPLLSTDNLRSLEVDNVASGEHPTQADLGLPATVMEPVAAAYLDQTGQADPLLHIRERAGRLF